MFTDAKEKISAVRIMLTQLDVTLGEALHHLTDIIRSIAMPNISIQLAAEAAIRKNRILA